MTADAISANPANTGVCQPGASARKLKAAPRLNTSTRLKKPVTSSRSPAANRASTTHLVARSASRTRAAMPNQGSALGIAARLAGAIQVALAAPAQTFGVDVGAVMPAAIAFRLLAG